MRVSKELVAINQLIEKLESKGFLVEMQHDHFPHGFVYRGNTDLVCSHVTTLTIYKPVAPELHIGQAYCSVKDSFCKATGAQIAFNHAIHSLTEFLGRDGMKALLS